MGRQPRHSAAASTSRRRYEAHAPNDWRTPVGSWVHASSCSPCSTAQLSIAPSTQLTLDSKQSTYDLVLPYRTKNLEWHLDRDLVKLIHVGQKGPLEQIMFTEDSVRGDVSLRVIDQDSDEGAIFVGRWDFSLQP